MELIMIIVLIFINAILASSEIAFISLNKYSIEKDIRSKNKKAIKIKKILENSSSFLATIQIGITLAGFFASAFAAETYSVIIVEKLKFLNISEDILKLLVMFVITIILSYFTLIFGELVPKKIALIHPKKIAYLTVDIIYILGRVTYPFVWILTRSTNFFAQAFGIKEEPKEHITEEDIRLLIAESTDFGNIERAEQELIYNVFNFNDTKVMNIMKNIKDVVSIDVNMSNAQIFEIIRTYKYTRMPVYESNRDNIIGILHIKDILLRYSKEEKLIIRDILREPLYINEKEEIDNVFSSMKSNNSSFSIVTNTNKVIVGIVTLEDILEEIVGNIFDEHDKK